VVDLDEELSRLAGNLRGGKQKRFCGRKGPQGFMPRQLRHLRGRLIGQSAAWCEGQQSVNGFS
jgi:hypothetical protein